MFRARSGCFVKLSQLHAIEPQWQMFCYGSHDTKTLEVSSYSNYENRSNTSSNAVSKHAHVCCKKIGHPFSAKVLQQKLVGDQGLKNVIHWNLGDIPFPNILQPLGQKGRHPRAQHPNGKKRCTFPSPHPPDMLVNVMFFLKTYWNMPLLHDWSDNMWQPNTGTPPKTVWICDLQAAALDGGRKELAHHTKHLIWYIYCHLSSIT